MIKFAWHRKNSNSVFLSELIISGCSEKANIEKRRLAVVCVPEDSAAERIAGAIRSMNPDAYVLVHCRYQGSANSLLRAGADAVISEEAEASGALLRALDRLEQPTP